MMSEYCILFLFLACFPKETKLTQLFCLAVCLLVCQPLFNNFEPVGWFQTGMEIMKVHQPWSSCVSTAWERTKSQRTALVGQQASIPTAIWDGSGHGIAVQPVGSGQPPCVPPRGQRAWVGGMMWWGEKRRWSGKEGGLLYMGDKSL